MRATAAAIVTLGLALAVPTVPALAADSGSTGSAPVAQTQFRPELPEASDHVVITGGFFLRSGERADDVVVVDGDVFIAARATVEGDLVAIAGDVQIAGTVEGDVTTAAGRATLLPGARVGGDLVYGDEEPEIADRASVGGEIRDENLADIWDWSWGVLGAVALWLAVTVSLLVAGIVLVAVFPRAADAAQRAARSQVALTWAMGIAAIIGLPLLGGLALVTVVGIPLTIVVGLALLPLAWLGYLVCCFVLGRVVTRDRAHPILAFLAGLGILRVIALIPALGLLAWIPAVALGLGALIVAAMGQRSGSTPSAPAAAA